MVALYGSQNGFGWKQGEIVGAQVVSIPLAVPLARAYQALFWFLLALAGTFVVTIVVVAGLIGRSTPPAADGIPYDPAASS